MWNLCSRLLGVLVIYCDFGRIYCALYMYDHIYAYMSYYLNKLRKALDKLIWGWMLCFLVIISHVWHVRCCSCNSCLSLILFACLLKLAHDLHAYGCSVVTLCLSCLFFLMHCLLYLCAFIHMHYCTSFRYDRWTTWRKWYWNRTRRRCLVDLYMFYYLCIRFRNCLEL